MRPLAVAMGIETRKSFVGEHLRAIDTFEIRTRKIEDEYGGKSWNEISSNIRTQHTTFSISGIIRSIAFLEANINEIIRRITMNLSNTYSGYELHPRLRSKVSSDKAQELIEKRKPTLDKYDTILREFGEADISTGKGVGQDVQSIIELRNHLVHASPSMLPPDQPPEEGIPKEVRWSNPFDTGNMASLNRCLGLTMIEWVADSCFEYAEEFFDRIDIENDISPNAQPLKKLYVDENPARPYTVVLENLQHDYR